MDLRRHVPRRQHLAPELDDHVEEKTLHQQEDQDRRDRDEVVEEVDVLPVLGHAIRRYRRHPTARRGGGQRQQERPGDSQQ